MSDIFISYARGDKHRAELLAEEFSQQGWSVWWDREIPPGQSFDETIENALNSARCVIVLWSKDSVSSRWVKTEAAEGATRGILVPVLIDKVQIPLEFRFPAVKARYFKVKVISSHGFSSVAVYEFQLLGVLDS